MGDKSKAPVATKEHQIGKVFDSIINDVKNGMVESKHESAVDIELNFQSVALSQKGIPLFSKNSKQSQMQIRLATQVLPDVDREGASTTPSASAGTF